MRKLITGVDSLGRSCVIAEAALAPQTTTSGTQLSDVYTTTEGPPTVPTTGDANDVDLGVPPGLVHWQIARFEPDRVLPMHRTDTIDLDMILEGSITLGLDSGEHVLEPGDCVVVAGVNHYWKAGPAGCRMNVTNIGAHPADRAG